MMKSLLLLSIMVISFNCFPQLSIKYNYIENDFRPYETYHIESFLLNGVKIDHDTSAQTSVIVKKLHEKFSSHGLLHDSEGNGDLFLTYKLQIDTLPIGFQRPRGPQPGDIVADLTIEIFDREYNEKLFTGNIYGLLVGDKKSSRSIKRVYNLLFNEFKR